jgi:hypothetical protein
MISGGAFLLLKTGSNGRERSKQAEIPLAGFATILVFGSRARSEVPGGQSRKGGKNALTVETASNSTDYG